MKARVEFTTEECAEYLGVPVSTLARWLEEERGPLHRLKLDGTPFYRKVDVDLWLERERNPHATEAWGFVDESKMAQLLCKTINALRKARSIKKDHPPYTKLGASVLYPIDEYLEWKKNLKKERAVT